MKHPGGDDTLLSVAGAFEVNTQDDQIDNQPPSSLLLL